MEKIYESLHFQEALLPAVYSAGAATGEVVSGVGFDRVIWLYYAGAHTATGTMDLKVQSCATSGGAYADVTSAAFVQVTDSTDNELYMLDMPVNPAKPYMHIIATNATADAAACVVAVLYNGSRAMPPTPDNTIVVL